MRVFHLLFRRESFTPQEGAAESFLEAALAEGRRYEEQVAQDLSGVVFKRVFPALVQALADAAQKGGTAAGLPEVHKAALIFLYRLLFVLYAEDRGLLPVNDSRYDDYGLRKRVRDDVAQRMEKSDTFSAAASNRIERRAAVTGWLKDAEKDPLPKLRFAVEDWQDGRVSRNPPGSEYGNGSTGSRWSRGCVGVWIQYRRAIRKEGL